jgi:hypothetical protein
VEAIPPTQSKILRISGLAFKSSMAVKEITEDKKDSVVVVLVHLALAKPGRSGSFVYELTLPDSVKQVRFGTSTTPIWERTPGS